MASEKILPDTCAWIDFFKGKQTPIAEALAQALTQQEVATCGVILYELLQGVKNPAEELLVLNAMQALPHLDITSKEWINAGRLSSTLRKNGHTIPLSDMIIATVALNQGYTVLTVDRHFELVSGLELVKI